MHWIPLAIIMYYYIPENILWESKWLVILVCLILCHHPVQLLHFRLLCVITCWQSLLTSQLTSLKIPLRRQKHDAKWSLITVGTCYLYYHRSLLRHRSVLCLCIICMLSLLLQLFKCYDTLQQLLNQFPATRQVLIHFNFLNWISWLSILQFV